MYGGTLAVSVRKLAANLSMLETVATDSATVTNLRLHLLQREETSQIVAFSRLDAFVLLQLLGEATWESSIHRAGGRHRRGI
jgi:hypothetical protein